MLYKRMYLCVYITLNQQGKNQAVSTGKLIRNIDLVPDYIISKVSVFMSLFVHYIT
jgi:predicted ThiF/HesA family dinucleotide-utilizing enzyme